PGSVTAMSSGCRLFRRRILHRRSVVRSAGRNTGTVFARADGSRVNLEYGTGSFSTRDSPADAITGGGAIGACAGGLAGLARGWSRPGGGAVEACGGGLAALATGCSRTGDGAVGACVGGLTVLAAGCSRTGGGAIRTCAGGLAVLGARWSRTGGG